jgi:hypothetical protein
MTDGEGVSGLETDGTMTGIAGVTGGSGIGSATGAGSVSGTKSSNNGSIEWLTASVG